MSRGRANSKPRRDARYAAAVRRQHALRAADLSGRLYAPVEEFLRPGDRVEMFVDVPAGVAA